jgi:hypothetical protein
VRDRGSRDVRAMVVPRLRVRHRVGVTLARRPRARIADFVELHVDAPVGVTGRGRAEKPFSVLGTLRAYPTAERNMHTKSKDSEHGSPVDCDADTSSYDQLQGGHNHGRRGQRNPKMPHERDESARSNATPDGEPQPAAEGRVKQAHDDVNRGLVDTGVRGIPDDIPASEK